MRKRAEEFLQKRKKIVAYHESGHALIAETTIGAKKVTKVSIIPRGLAALGYTLNTPEENKYLMQKHELIAEIDVLLGGRAAEEIFIEEISTGAANDLERATDIVKSMVMMYGMSEVAGLMVIEKQRNLFLNGAMGQVKEYSDKLAEDIDEFIKNFLNERYIQVKKRLSEYSEAIEGMVKELFEKEVLEGKRVREIIKEFEEKKGIKSKLVPEDNEDIEEAKKKIKKDESEEKKEE